jgi:phosphatidylglycerophosphate synthase
VIQAALISLPSRAGEPIFGRPLLERLVTVCGRAGIRRFIIEASAGERARAVAALGSHQDDPTVEIVDSLKAAEGIEPAALCVRFSGNLILARSQLERVFNEYLRNPSKPLTIFSTDRERGGTISVGPVAELLEGAAPATSASKHPAAPFPKSQGAPTQREDAERGEQRRSPASPFSAAALLPFALNGRPEDRNEAEIRLARAVRQESSSTDALMARVVDRRVSWRLSLRLARTRITPNQITLANTAIGLGCAAMFASTSYWLRLCGAVVFLVSITLDGVDGELARLRMLESSFGERLDVLTDNLVHVAIFAGMATGCYRLSNSSAYFYALAILLAGFCACAVSVNRALSIASDKAHQWFGLVERATGRDFAYVLLILAIFDRLYFFVWGAAFGTHAFALILWWLTDRFRKKTLSAAQAAIRPLHDVATIKERL